MSTPDLPPELWLEILSHFPPSFVVRLMGVNRFLFNLALNYVYEELRVELESEGSLQPLRHLRYGSNATRVRRLYIRPAFLPGMGEVPEEQRDPDAFERFVDRFSTNLRCVFRKVRGLDSIERPGLPNPQSKPAADHTVYEVLRAAVVDMALCEHLDKVTIVLYDYFITPTFSSFLNTLWTSIGDKLQTLVIQTTLFKVHELMISIANHAHELRVLGSLDFSLMYSRFALPANTSPSNYNGSITKFLSLFKHTLSHLCIASTISHDMSSIFEDLGEFPKLKKFELHMVMCRATLSKRLSLSRFLEQNKESLTYLDLQSITRSVVFTHQTDTLHAWVSDEFWKMHLPNVTGLELGLSHEPEWLDYRKPFPPTRRLTDVIPNLKTLKIKTQWSLHRDEPLRALEVAGPSIEELDVWVSCFTPEFLNQLVRKAPNLQSLTLGYSWSSINGIHPAPANVYAIMRDAGPKYYRWPLKRVWVGSRGRCVEIHPNMIMADCFEQLVGRPIEKVDQWLCTCD